MTCLNSVLHKYSEIQCGHKYISSVLTAGEIRDQTICDFTSKQNKYRTLHKNCLLKTNTLCLTTKINTLINKNTMTSSAGYMF